MSGAAPLVWLRAGRRWLAANRRAGGGNRWRRTSNESLARLVAMRSGSAPAGVPDTVLAEVVAELDRLMGGARGARGDARQSILDRLEQLDARLLAAARDAMPEDAMAVVKAEATADLKPFEERMSREVWARTLTLAVDRAIRERARLPTLAVE